MVDQLNMNNISIFDCMYEDFKIDKPIRLIELFAGVGSQAMALRNLETDFEHYRVVEFDKYAIASYNAIHGTNFETMDITKVKGKDLKIVDTDKYTYIMTYSFPCQDLSVAGKMQGMTKDSGTRSGLLWEVERLLNEVEELPQVLLMENVPQVIGKKNIDNFHLWQQFLEDKGYSNFTDTLNAKNYGVAQNRNRTFMVSILGQWNYEFPKQIPLTKTMKDYLEDEVDEKYYINNEKAQKLIDDLISSGKIDRQQTADSRQIMC
jgi:DNA (cytosine-5)-methyltransferase 1